MKFHKLLFVVALLLFSCKPVTEKKTEEQTTTEFSTDFTIAFGSCNKQWKTNELWQEVIKSNPDVWVWGGDIIYSDTEDMEVLEDSYSVQKQNEVYANFSSKVEIMGTWDDHDFGENDAGTEYPKKENSQQLFLNFMDVPNDSPRRNQKGIYFSKDFVVEGNSIKIIILDTRYFRTTLTEDNDTDHRYKPNEYGVGTILGEVQWNWLQSELKNSTASFNIIMSSIQILSGEHGWETWANMPHEVDKLIETLKTTQAKNTIILSGDRHISDFSKKEIDGISYPLIDFTSSGLTHSSTRNTGEPNQYRIGDMVNQLSFGLLKFDFSKQEVLMEMRGLNNELQQSHSQNYE
ncbi:MAG: alkaline phosphatase D family protein [Urechidicola sp.]|nr:alkaline phosphatase D family protein [Urechidicola sp.]